jgi:Ca2+-binding EF-hand superfamily protein
MDFEKSDVRPVAADGDAAAPPPDIITITLQTTVAVKDGHAMIVEGSRLLSQGGKKDEALMVVGARSQSPASQAGPPRASSAVNRAKAPPSRKPSEAGGEQRDSRLVLFAKAMMKRYDKNGDGELELGEWSQMRTDASKADANENGRITIEEFTRWLATHSGVALPKGATGSRGSAPTVDGARYQRYAEGLIRRYDDDSDGELDADERSKSEMLRNAADADVNRDGKVSAKELGNWMLKQRSR